MRRIIAAIMIMAAAWISGCSNLHDERGWEHMDNSETHQDAQPYILEHQH